MLVGIGLCQIKICDLYCLTIIKPSLISYGSHIKPIIYGRFMTITSLLSRCSQAALIFCVLNLSACSNTPLPENPPNFSQGKIYINQVAFDVRAPKQAVISLPEGETATRFTVQQGQHIIYQGKLVTQSVFKNWGGDAQFYIADFSSIKRRGEFFITVNTQKQQIKSSPFTIKPNAYFDLTAKSLLNYFKANRHIKVEDSDVRISGTEQRVNVYGGWNNAGGDQGKQLSHSTQSNFLVSQQGAIAIWAMAKSYNKISKFYDRKGLTTQIANEVMWGADHLHRLLAEEGYFYENISDNRGTNDERLIVGEGNTLNELNYQAAYREGAGFAIAALVNAYQLGLKTHIHGEVAPSQYLKDATAAFEHLQKNNPKYLANATENIIDDYSALVAATALYKATKNRHYLKVARYRARNLNSRVTKQGWFVSDNDKRPFYHNSEAGMPIIALVDYIKIEPKHQLRAKTKLTIKAAIDYQLAINAEVSNPFNLARQSFSTYQDNMYSPLQSGFFMPHANEANDWRGENARLASLTAAMIWGGKYTHANPREIFSIKPEVANFAQSQMDWILGKNPYQMSMLYGFGINNPPHAKSAGSMLNGGISNGITGATLNADGSGITWAEGPDDNNWRWTEQWLQNTAWYLLAVTAMAE